MKKWLYLFVILVVSICSTQLVHAQVAVKVLDSNNNYVTTDTFVVTIDSGFQWFPTYEIIKYKLYNYSPTDTIYFDFELDWFCSNSDLSAQICEHFYNNAGVCHFFHKEGKMRYDKHTLRKIYPDANNNDNFMAFDFKVRYFNIEDKYEKCGKITFFKSNSTVVLDSLYIIIKRGTLACTVPQPEDTTGLGIATGSTEHFSIYPNPASDYIYISSDRHELHRYILYAADGSTVSSGNVEALTDRKLNVSELSDGMYFLKVTDSNNNAYIRKIMLQH